MHRKEYKKALDDFQEALKLVRKIENSLGNVFITSEDTFKQLDVLNLEKPEVGRREAWEENIPPRKRE